MCCVCGRLFVWLCDCLFMDAFVCVLACVYCLVVWRCVPVCECLCVCCLCVCVCLCVCCVCLCVCLCVLCVVVAVAVLVWFGLVCFGWLVGWLVGWLSVWFGVLMVLV